MKPAPFHTHTYTQAQVVLTTIFHEQKFQKHKQNACTMTEFHSLWDTGVCRRMTDTQTGVSSTRGMKARIHKHQNKRNINHINVPLSSLG